MALEFRGTEMITIKGTRAEIKEKIEQLKSEYVKKILQEEHKNCECSASLYRMGLVRKSPDRDKTIFEWSGKLSLKISDIKPTSRANTELNDGR